MNLNETIKERMSDWPRKLTSVMEIQRQRFSELNKKFKQTPVVNSSRIQPIILPQTSRPQPRQQARLKPQIQVHLPPTRRSNTVQNRYPSSHLTLQNDKYITLDNLSRILHVLQIREKAKEQSDTATVTSASTSTSAKQRVQQHLQETATRWWRPIRSSDSQPLSSIIYSSGVVSTANDESILQSQKNIPLLTIVSNSTQQMNTLSNEHSKYDESEVSTEILPINVVTSGKIRSLQRTRQEPLLMQARGMHLHSSDHRRYNYNNNNMNFFQQQRLIRQT